MLLEFVTHAGGSLTGPAHILVGQITDVSQALFERDRFGSAVGLRSGRVILVEEKVEDILDALSYVTRHIGVSPGIADKVDGEREEVYPWRRREKVSALAEKWRNYARTTAAGEKNAGKPSPFYVPTVLPPNPKPPWLVPPRMPVPPAQDKAAGKIDQPFRFARLTEQARDVMRRATEAAVQFGCPDVRVDHLTRGLVTDDHGSAVDVLRNLGVSLPDLRTCLDRIICVGEAVSDSSPQRTPLADEVYRVIDLANEASQAAACDRVGTEHLLLGLLDEPDVFLVRWLETRGVRRDEVRAEVARVVGLSSAVPLVDETGRLRTLSPEQARLMRPSKERGDLVNEVILTQPLLGQAPAYDPADSKFLDAVDAAVAELARSEEHPSGAAARAGWEPTIPPSRFLTTPAVGHGRHQEPPVADPPESPEDLNDPRR